MRHAALSPGSLRRFLARACLCVLAGQQAVAASPPGLDLTRALHDARTSLRLDRGRLAGPAAPVLTAAIADSRYVAIGEAHLTREIPAFTAAMCDAMAPGGLDAMALETSPNAAALINRALPANNIVAVMRAQIRRYPESVAFMDMRDELDLISHCSRTAANPRFRIVGLDQEYIGAGDWLLDMVLAEKLTPQAASEIRRLRAQSQHDTQEAAATGDPYKLFLLRASSADLASGARALQAGGTARARDIFQALVESHDIYVTAHSPESNRTRGLLLRRTLLQALARNDHPPRLLLKFGDNHMYKGFNPIHQRDLGNFIAERADGEGARSLHIVVLGASGTLRSFGGYARPTNLETFSAADDPDVAWLQPALANQLRTGWTVFDFRDIRFRKLTGVDEHWRRLLDGYDFLVLMPALSPADPL